MKIHHAKSIEEAINDFQIFLESDLYTKFRPTEVLTIKGKKEKKHYKRSVKNKMSKKYICDRCEKLLTDKEYKKSEAKYTFLDLCKKCLPKYLKFQEKQEKERVKFMNQEERKR